MLIFRLVGFRGKLSRPPFSGGWPEKGERRVALGVAAVGLLWAVTLVALVVLLVYQLT